MRLSDSSRFTLGFLIQFISQESAQRFPWFCPSFLYKAPGKSLYVVARIFCLDLPGSCLAKHAYFFRGPCIQSSSSSSDYNAGDGDLIRSLLRSNAVIGYWMRSLAASLERSRGRTRTRPNMGESRLKWRLIWDKCTRKEIDAYRLLFFVVT